MDQPDIRARSVSPQEASAVRWQPFAFAFLLVVLINWTITEEMSAHYGFPGIYHPFHWLSWWAARAFHASGEDWIYLRTRLFEAAGSFTTLMIVARIWVSVINRRANLGQEDLHGSARFATIAEIDKSDLAQPKGLIIGGYNPDPEHPEYIRFLRDDTDEHLLGFAPTGSGKTSCLVIPNLLDIQDASVFVTDPTGQLYQKTAGWRAEHSDVYKFAPMDIAGSNFNIFAEIRWGTDREYSDIAMISRIMTHVPGKAAVDPHWDQIADSLNIGLIYHAGYMCLLEGTMPTGLMIEQMLNPPGSKMVTRTVKQEDGSVSSFEEEVPLTFQDTLEKMLTFEHDPDGIHYNWTIPDADGRPKPTKTHPIVLAKAKEMLNRIGADGPNNEFTGAVSTLGKRYGGYLNPMIQRHTGTSDFRIDDLVNGARPATLYVVIPLSDDDTLQPMLRVMQTVFFKRYSETERLLTPNKWQMIWMLEEFPQHKQMEIYESSLATIRQFGHRFFLIAQGTKQIEHEYGSDTAIVSNCGRHLAFTPQDEDTAKLLSSMTGTTTVTHVTASFSGKTAQITPDNTTRHVQRVKRELMTPDEIRRLPTADMEGRRVVRPGNMLIFRRGKLPIWGVQTFYFFCPEFVKRSEIPPPTAWPKNPSIDGWDSWHLPKAKQLAAVQP